MSRYDLLNCRNCVPQARKNTVQRHETVQNQATHGFFGRVCLWTWKMPCATSYGEEDRWIDAEWPCWRSFSLIYANEFACEASSCINAYRFWRKLSKHLVNTVQHSIMEMMNVNKGWSECENQSAAVQLATSVNIWRMCNSWKKADKPNAIVPW